MMKNTNLLGVAVPLGALYTKENQIIGEFPDLVPFAEFCKKSNINLIQLIPVNDTGTQSSPYSGLSAFALHPIYIRLSDVEGFDSLCSNDKKFCSDYNNFSKANKYKSRYNYDEILNSKTYFLLQLYNQTEIAKSEKPTPELSTWIKKNPWIKTYAVYKNLKYKYMQASWKSWKKEDKTLTLEEIEKLWDKKSLKKDHLFYAWVQFVADEQFSKAVDSVHNLQIKIKGDMPILMNEDSCDAWAYPQFFNHNLRAGSPSDGENPNGQNWGFPTYNWKNLQNENYSWWINRLKTASKYYDAYRLDHILGFFRIWAIPEKDCNALNGHTEPFSSIKKDELYELGFDDDRIRWLSKPHIPTSAIEDITWNREIAHKILKLVANQIGQEELWLFSDKIKGSTELANLDLSDFVDKPAEEKIQNILVNYWSNITLLEVAKNKFVPLWTYQKSTSWETLNQKEKEDLEKLFEKLNTKNEKLWQKQASQIFTALTSNVKMIPCGEDLGVGIACVPETMKNHDILGLRVVRWCRYWEKENQPFVAFKDYENLSVVTTSVHDSSTLRQWWDDEKESVLAFLKENPQVADLKNKNEIIDKKIDEKSDKKTSPEEEAKITEKLSDFAKKDFSPEIAQKVLQAVSQANSMWFIPPLQDILYLSEKYYAEDSKEERINIPGTVTQFNWTYRMPVSIEELSKNKEIISNIKLLSRG